MADTVEHYRNQIAQARTEIKNLRQQLSALKHEHTKEIKLIKSALSELKCSCCAEQATTLVTNQNSHYDIPASTSGSPGNNGIWYRPIGTVETSFQNKRGVPRQPSVMAKAKGTLIINTSVFNNPEHALSGLQEFSHMWIIFHFHTTESNSVPAKVSPPRLGGARRGVLSTRSPHRPCPIGLSLVKIQSIEGNKIHFLGVDMVNGTPVLDIKPYIPQYDYPAMFGNSMSLERPPTEGISDATVAMAALNVDDDRYETRSLSPRLTHPMRIDTNQSPLSRSPYETDNMASPNQPNDLVTLVSPSPDSPPSIEMLDTPRSPSSRLADTERGAPDGQERFTPPQTNAATNLHGVRIAPWIADPPVQTYEVRVTDDVDARLTELIGNRAPGFKNNIQSLLSEDPRSNYVRTRYPDHEYSCVLEDLSISCVFDSNSSVCTIITVRSAEDMQT